MCKTTLNLRGVRILAMILCPVLTLLGLMRLTMEPAAWRVMMVTVSVVWLVDLAVLMVVVSRNKLLSYRMERTLVVVNIGMALVPWVWMWHGLMALDFWRLCVMIGGVIAFSLTTAVDVLCDTVRRIPWVRRLRRRMIRKMREKNLRTSDNVCVEARVCESPPEVGRLERCMKFIKKAIGEVLKKMANFVEGSETFSMQVVIPDGSRVYELDELISMMRAEEADAGLSEGADKVVEAIAGEISANLAASDLNGETAPPPELQASMEQTVTEGLDDQKKNAGQLAVVDDEEEEDTFIDKRHPDLGAMRKKYSFALACLSILLGGMLGIIGTRLEATILGPLVQENLMQIIILAAIATAVGIAFRQYACYVVTKERMMGWVAATILITLVAGMMTEAMQSFGWLDTLVAVKYKVEISRADIAVAVGAVLTICVIWQCVVYRQRCDEASVAAFDDATEIMSKIEEVESADVADYGQGTLASSLSLKMGVIQFFRKERVMPRADHAV